MMKRSLGLLTWLILAVRLVVGMEWPLARVTVKVIGEDGQPISNALVHVGFSQGGNPWIGEYKGQTFHGRTDTGGYYSAQARSEMTAGGSVEKEGYYRSSWEYTFRADCRGLSRWEPWDPVVTVVLRRVVNPIPMYAKSVETKIPKAGEAYGFDLMIGDWVAPYGKGQVSDFVFRVEGYWNSYADNVATMFLSFVNGGDGIQKMDVSMFGGSKFRSCREAPTVGYQPVGIWRKMRIDQPNGAGTTIVRDYDSSAIHVFRIRSVTNERGDVVWAYYGTLRGDIEFGGAGEEGTYLNFTYYLNPTPNDRNLEFDPKRNLFTDLKPGERVYDP